MEKKRVEFGRLRDARKKFHVTVNGWPSVPIHELAEVQFQCQEIGELGNKHTHIGVLLSQKIKGTDMLKWAKGFGEGEPDIAWHNKWDTIVGYHYGAGGKEACTGVVWQKGCQLSDTVVKRKYSYAVIRDCKRLEDLKDFIVRPGSISGLLKDWGYLKVPKSIDPPEKRRHFIVVDQPNKGKSQMISLNFPRSYMKLPDKWWDNYERQKFIWCDESYPPWTETKKWTNASGKSIMVEIKGGVTWLRPDSIFFISANSNPWSEYMEKNPRELDALLTRFWIVNASELRLLILKEKGEESIVYCDFHSKMEKVKNCDFLKEEIKVIKPVEVHVWEEEECELATLWDDHESVKNPVQKPSENPMIPEESKESTPHKDYNIEHLFEEDNAALKETIKDL